MAADQSPALPKNPDLERFRRDARRLQRALVAGEQQALDLHARLHPAGADAPVTLTAAQLMPTTLQASTSPGEQARRVRAFVMRLLIRE